MCNSDRLPVDDPAFWKDRLLNVVARGEDLHKAVWNTDHSSWVANNEECRRILTGLLPRGCRLLDAGCGLGGLVPYLPQEVAYTGVDLSPEFLELARLRYPTRTFVLARLDSLPFPEGHFEVAVVRSVKKMVVDNLGRQHWEPLQHEILRVADRMVVLEYDEANLYEIINTWRHVGAPEGVGG